MQYAVTESCGNVFKKASRYVCMYAQKTERRKDGDTDTEMATPLHAPLTTIVLQPSSLYVPGIWVTLQVDLKRCLMYRGIP